MTEPDGRISRNRELWALVNHQHTDADARRQWSHSGVRWGMFGTPEAALDVLGDVAGTDVLDLACGTGYFGAWLTRAGARVVAVDASPDQLATARRCQDEFDVHFPLLEADAERLPLADDSFDLIVSEHGAGVWCEPDAWLAEATRVLRPGGRLVFLVNSVLSTLCVPANGGVATEQLLRGQRDVERITWPGGGTEFHLSHGGWIAALRRHGFAAEALHELYPDADAGWSEAVRFYEIVDESWAWRWPAEELWVAHLRGTVRQVDDARHADP